MTTSVDTATAEATLTGQVAMVTGAARGIGRCMALALAERGARVAVVDILDGSETVNAVRDLGGEALGLEADLTDPDAVDRAIAQTVEKFGGLNLLVNNAGLAPHGASWPPLRGMEPDFLEKILRINLVTMFHTTRVALPHLTVAGNGRVINMSGSGRRSRRGPYMISKAGVEELTRVLWEEERENGVVVTAFRPIMRIALEYESEEVRSRRPGPESIIPHFLWTVSASAEEVGGKIIHSDGTKLEVFE